MTLFAKGKVQSLCINPGHRMAMREVPSADFVAGRGMESDRYFSTKEDVSDNQILLMDQETLNDLELAPSVVRENITTSGIDLYVLPLGAELRIGEYVLLRISRPCPPCSRMEEVRPGLRYELEGRRGLLATVLEGGSVNIGDPVCFG